MGYCEIKDVISMIKEDMINSIIGNEYIEDEDEQMKKINALAETAISDADAEINGYLVKRYNVPFSSIPAVINKFSKDIAVYNLVSRAGIDEGEREKTILNRYNAAIKYLENVAKGIVDIGVKDNSATESAKIGFAMSSSNRIFSRDSMRGW